MDARKRTQIKIEYIRGKYQYKLKLKSKYIQNNLLKGSLKDILKELNNYNIENFTVEDVKAKINQGYTHVIIYHVSDISR